MRRLILVYTICLVAMYKNLRYSLLYSEIKVFDFISREECEISPPGSPVAPGDQEMGQSHHMIGQSHLYSISHLDYSRSFSLFIQCLENVSSEQMDDNTVKILKFGTFNTKEHQNKSRRTDKMHI